MQKVRGHLIMSRTHFRTKKRSFAYNQYTKKGDDSLTDE